MNHDKVAESLNAIKMEQYNEILMILADLFPNASKREIHITLPQKDIEKFSDDLKKSTSNCIVILSPEVESTGTFTQYSNPYGSIELTKENARQSIRR